MGLKKEVKSFGAALNGIYLMRLEVHFRFIFIVALALLTLMFLLPTTSIEKGLLLLCATLVISLEIVNSAIEHLANKVDKRYDELIKKCKDMAAGAVLFASIMALVIGGIILLPYLWAYC